jgi:hypothetical protein
MKTTMGQLKTVEQLKRLINEVSTSPLRYLVRYQLQDGSNHQATFTNLNAAIRLLQQFAAPGAGGDPGLINLELKVIR